MRANDSKSSGIGTVLLGVTAVALAGMVGTVGLLQTVGDLGPKVGEIVSFDPMNAASRDMKVEITTVRADDRSGTTCVLDAGTMRANGGSLIVEARLPQTPTRFRVHWAGGGSSPGATNCGAAADLLLTQEDLDLIAMAAGGFGVVERRLTRIASRTPAATTR